MLSDQPSTYIFRGELEEEDMASGELPKRREDEKDVTVKEGEMNALDDGATASNSACTRGDLYIFAPDRDRKEAGGASLTSCRK